MPGFLKRDVIMFLLHDSCKAFDFILHKHGIMPHLRLHMVFFFPPPTKKNKTKNFLADLLLKYFRVQRCRTGLVPPLGTLFHSVMTCAQLLGPPHNHRWFPPRLLFIIKQAAAPILTGWSMTLPQRLLTYCIVRYTLITEAPHWSVGPPLTYIFPPTVQPYTAVTEVSRPLWDFSLSVRIMSHQTSQHRNCAFWWVNNAALIPALLLLPCIMFPFKVRIYLGQN